MEHLRCLLLEMEHSEESVLIELIVYFMTAARFQSSRFLSCAFASILQS